MLETRFARIAFIGGCSITLLGTVALMYQLNKLSNSHNKLKTSHEKMKIYAFFEAVENGDKNATSTFLEDDPSLVHRIKGDDRRSPMHVALLTDKKGDKKGTLEVIYKFDPGQVHALDADNLTPLHCASQKLHNGAITFLLEKNVDPNSNETRWKDKPLNWNALHTAVCDHNVVDVDIVEKRKKVIKSLCEGGVDINARDACGRTPFYIAVDHLADREILQFLLDQGADISIKTYSRDEHDPVNLADADEFSRTPLHKAAEKGHTYLFDFLIEALEKRGISRDMPDEEGKTYQDLLKTHVTPPPARIAFFKYSNASACLDSVIGASPS